MGRIFRWFFIAICALFIVCQVPSVQHYVIKKALPASFKIDRIKTFGLFPIYIHVPELKIKKGDCDFLDIQDGILDMRYMLLRKQVAFDAKRLTISKTLSEKKLTIQQVLDQLRLATAFHDFNIASFQYQDQNKVILDYKVDWDLKQDRVKLYAQSNTKGLYPERIEIEGAPFFPDEIKDGTIKVIQENLCLFGTFNMKDNQIKTDLTLQQKNKQIARIYPTIELTDENYLNIPELKILSPFFQWTGAGKVDLDSLATLFKGQNFFLALNPTQKDGSFN